MRKKKVKPATVVSYEILTIFALIVLVPFIWFVSTSFDYVKSYSLRFPPRLIPKEFSTFNYKMAFSNVPMLSIKRYYLHTCRICTFKRKISGKENRSGIYSFQYDGSV